MTYKHGSEADNNVYRFSTKYFDTETGMYYYGFRFFSPELGRWISRDPIGEQGFETLFTRSEIADINLYAFAFNDPFNKYDPLGLAANWHHMLPQKFRGWFAYRGLDIDSAEFGWILPEESHRIKGGPYGKIHPEWENEWNRFITNNQNATRQEVLKKLDKMKRKRRFVNILAQGSKATMSHKKWLDLAGETREKFVKKYRTLIIKKKSGQIIVKKSAILGLIFILTDINNKGFAGGITNNLLDQVPYLGWTKMADECVHGDWIPDKGEVSSLTERYKDVDAFSEIMM